MDEQTLQMSEVVRGMSEREERHEQKFNIRTCMWRHYTMQPAITIKVETFDYGLQPDPFRQFDLYTPQDSHQKPLICFIHGGAWRS